MKFDSIVCVLCRRAVTNLFYQNEAITMRSHSWYVKQINLCRFIHVHLTWMEIKYSWFVFDLELCNSLQYHIALFHSSLHELKKKVSKLNLIILPVE